MNIPWVAKVYIREQNKSKIKLWLPLFLLYPFVALVFLFLAPLLLIVFLFMVMFLRFTQTKKLGLFIKEIPMLFCALKGLEIDVKDKDSQVLICIT